MRRHDSEAEGKDSLRPPAARIDEEPASMAWEAAATGRLDALDPGGVSSLQRTIGNRTISRIVGQEDESLVHSVVGSSGGSTMSDEVRGEMEQRLGHDFGDVKIHTGTTAHDSAVSVNAQAYTVGSDVVFRHGKYDPGSSEGKTMLAHELTHVVQQRSGPVDGTPVGGGVSLSDPSDRFEREASATAEQAMSAPLVAAAPATGASGSVQRQEDPDLDEADVQGSFVQRVEDLDEQPDEAAEG